MDAKLKERLLEIVESTPYNLGQLEQIITLDLMAKAFDLDRGSDWVDVKERLPEINKPVMVYTDLNYMGEGELIRQNIWLLIGVGVANNITHWQPLPQPPQEKEK